AELHAALHARAAAVFGAETKSRAAARRYRELAAKLAEGAALPARHVYLVGFTSAKGMQRALLHALVRRPGVRLWLNESPETEGGGKSPLQMLQAMLEVDGVRRSPVE